MANFDTGTYGNYGSGFTDSFITPLNAPGQGQMGIPGMSSGSGARVQTPLSSVYEEKLRQLAGSPNSVFDMPGYKAGEQAVERRMAAQGFGGSGNMAVELANYGGDFYRQAMQMYANLWQGARGVDLGQGGLDLQRQQFYASRQDQSRQNDAFMRMMSMANNQYSPHPASLFDENMLNQYHSNDSYGNITPGNTGPDPYALMSSYGNSGSYNFSGGEGDPWDSTTSAMYDENSMAY
jgi:hypothetical protein